MKKIKPEERFWLKNGEVIEDLNELAKAFKVMDKEIFEHHVTKDRNDFSNWVRYVMRDNRLADDLLKAKNKEEARELVINSLKPAEPIVILPKKVKQKPIISKKRPKVKKEESSKLIEMIEKKEMPEEEIEKEMKEDKEIEIDVPKEKILPIKYHFQLGFKDFFLGVVVGAIIMYFLLRFFT